MTGDENHCDQVARERIAALDRRLTENMAHHDRATQIAMTAAEKAVAKAETASEKRFEGVNEFRQTLTDQAATFIRQSEVTVMVNSLKENIGRLETRMAEAAGRGSGAGDLWKGILAVVGALIGIAGFALAVLGS